jgi:hypothetical protein
MYHDKSLPQARRDGLLEESVGEELLLYDRSSHTAHCLSPIAACVWRHCDGERDVTELAELAVASEDLVADALRELREKDLLDAEPVLMQSAIPGVSRREAIVRVARYGAAVAGASMIVSATAATPAMASSELVSAKCGKGSTTCCVCKGGTKGFSGLTSEEVCEEAGRCGTGNVQTWSPANAQCEGTGCST